MVTDLEELNKFLLVFKTINIFFRQTILMLAGKENLATTYNIEQLLDLTNEIQNNKRILFEKGYASMT